MFADDFRDGNGRKGGGVDANGCYLSRGWAVPFIDSEDKKRGGVQVDDQPPVAHLDAE